MTDLNLKDKVSEARKNRNDNPLEAQAKTVLGDTVVINAGPSLSVAIEEENK